MAYGNPNCRTCSHADVAAIDALIARNVPAAQVARRFSLTQASVLRHKKSHIDPALLRRLKAKALRADQAGDLEELRETESTNLLLRVASTRARINAILDAAEKSQDYRGAVQAVRALHENYALVGRLVGELANGQTVVNNSLVLAPDYLKLRALLIEALRPFPAARIAVAKALRAIESPAEAVAVTPEPRQIEAIDAPHVQPAIPVVEEPQVFQAHEHTGAQIDRDLAGGLDRPATATVEVVRA
jgi:hypothetical protein